MGRQCLTGQEHDRNVDALLVQFNQQVDAGNLRPVAMEDDDVGIAGGIACVEQRRAILESPDGKALLGQFIGRELTIDRVVVYEKDANGVRLADGGKQRGLGRFQGCEFLFKSGGHLSHSPSLACRIPRA